MKFLLALATFRLEIRRMTKQALFAVAGVLSLCHSLCAQQIESAGPLQFEGGTLNRPFLRLPSVSLADRDRVSFLTAFSWQTPLDFLPPFDPVEPRSVASSAPVSRRDSAGDTVELRSADRIRASGEVGFLYGKSSGKYGREVEQGYILGSVGNDKFTITVGTSYERSSGRVPRWGR